MKRILLCFLVIIFITLTVAPALAAIGVDSVNVIYKQITENATTWKTKIAEYVLYLLYSMTLIAFLMGLKDLALSGSGLQMEGIVALIVKIALMTGFMAWILKNPDYLLEIPESLTAIGVYIGGTKPTVDGVTQVFLRIIDPLSAYYYSIDWLTKPGPALVSIVLIFLVYCFMSLFAVTVMLVQIETIFILIAGMITAAFFVIGYFRDLFMGYIKALAMNGLKLFILALLLGLITTMMGGWGTTLSNSMGLKETSKMVEIGGYYYVETTDLKSQALYDTAIPMVFGIMAFYIILKSVPQYAVAILTGHATADGSLAKAAYSAGVASVATVWNVAHGGANMLSDAARSTGAIVSNAANAYKNTSQNVLANKGSETEAKSIGAISAIGAALNTPLSGFRGSQSSSSGTNKNGTANSDNNNSMGPGKANDPYANLAADYDKKIGMGG